jgi:hypothetical protein
LQLPDRFEWQVALLRFFERRISSMRSCRPDRGIISALLRPDFGTQTQRFLMNSSSGLRGTLINQMEPRRCDSAPRGLAGEALIRWHWQHLRADHCYECEVAFSRANRFPLSPKMLYRFAKSLLAESA